MRTFSLLSPFSNLSSFFLCSMRKKSSHSDSETSFASLNSDDAGYLLLLFLLRVILLYLTSLHEEGRISMTLRLYQSHPNPNPVPNACWESLQAHLFVTTSNYLIHAYNCLLPHFALSCRNIRIDRIILKGCKMKSER